MEILKMIENGEISMDEGIRRINELDEEISSTPEKNNFSTLEILEKIEAGEISADEAINFISGSPTQDEEESEENSENYDVPNQTPHISEQEMSRWKRWWTYPLYAGVGIVILSTFWLNSAYQNSGFGFWFFCAWLPLLIGLVLMALSWQSRGGPWIHVRVRGDRERVAISIPAPLGLASWGLRNFGHYIPQLEKTTVDEIILALESTTKANAPIYVQVDDGENGEKVEVFIG